MTCIMNICNCFFKMNPIPNIIIVGEKGIGKSLLIKDIISGKKISKKLSIICNNSKYIRINNTIYGKSLIKRLCCCFIYEETVAIILANTQIQKSLDSIPIWYEKIRKTHTNIHIYLIILNDFEKGFVNNIYDIYYFCSKNNISLIRI